MKNIIDCFIPFSSAEETTKMVNQLREECLVNKVYVIVAGSDEKPEIACDGFICVESMVSAECVRAIAAKAASEYLLVQLTPADLEFGYYAANRMVAVAKASGAACVYSDYSVWKSDSLIASPTMDVCEGSVRDDFDFGNIVVFSTERMKQFATECQDSEWKAAGWYELQLWNMRHMQAYPMVHIKENLYRFKLIDVRKSGEKQFDYVDPRNRARQIEMEEVATRHLKQIGAYVATDSIKDVNVDEQEFLMEASVIIPVRNRVRTIEDAVRSALSQKADFPFNVIVVDNFSTDGTSEILERMAAEDSRCVHIVPERNDLAIGGCWSLAINDSRCGRFAVQLDSDDLYSGDDTLKRVVEKFRAERCAMVIGSYRMCDFSLNTLPPGLIDHKEWTDDNGRNNALRINGLGAPRAFYTPVLRNISIPNTSYGEDYALGLAISRKFRIGRIFEELYLCRRWEGNSDSALSPEQVNRNNIYKDSLREMEIRARKQLNCSSC